MKRHHWPKGYTTVIAEPLKIKWGNLPLREQLYGETDEQYQEYLDMREDYDSKSQ